jgi:fatty-acyl-CoA synthase
VPTVWIGVLNHPAASRAALSSLRTVICGGAAVPRSLIEAFEKRLGVRMIQGWGMTETSPLAALARPPGDIPVEEHLSWRAMTGRVVPGVEIRITDFEGKPQTWNGEAIGEIQARGPWVTAAYYLDDSRDRFHDGWLRTGDVGTINDRGFIQITDRVKDVIKSGGEWISSVEIENALMGHPEVLECAVIARPDEKWSERPLACVVRKPGSSVTAEALRAFLSGRVAQWAVPEYWTFIAEVPKTSVGKFDKKVLRARQSQQELEVISLLK